MPKVCSGFGHSEVFENIKDDIAKAVTLMDEEWIESLQEHEEYEPSEKHKKFMSEHFGANEE